jgi:TfoX/Sxy family transcriptional regulator of competence genes
MPYDEGLAHRLRDLLADRPSVVEKRMFGGVGFIVQGNMCCGIHEDELIVRVGTDQYEEAVTKPHARVFDLTGRPMKGWVCVDPAGFESDEDLADWVEQGWQFASSLPPK